MPRRSETPIEILEVLNKEDLSTGKLAKKVGKAQKNVIKALNNLQEDGFVIRRINPRRYQITEIGKVVLRNTQLTELLRDRKFLVKIATLPSEINLLRKKYGKEILRHLIEGKKPPLLFGEDDVKSFKEIQDFWNKTEKSRIIGREKVFQDVLLLQSRQPIEQLPRYFPVGITIVTNKDIDPKKIFEFVKNEFTIYFENLVSRMIVFVGESNFARMKMLRNLSKIRLREDLAWIKAAYDFDLTMIVHANGRELLNNIDWKEATEKAEELDTHLQELAQEIEKDWKNNRQRMLKEQISLFLDDAAKRNSLDRLLQINTELRLNEEETLAKLAEGLKAFLGKKVSQKEIQTALEDKQKAGELRIVPTVFYRIET